MSDKAGRVARAGGFIVLFASVAFATSSPLSRLARPAHPLFVAFARVAIAALVLGLLDLRGIVRSFSVLAARDRLRVALAGALLAAHFALFQWGLDETSLPAAVSLVSLEPLSVVLCAWAFFGIAPSRPEKIGVALATAGAVIVSRGAGEGEHRLFGDVLVLGAVALFGLYVASARGLRDALPAMHYAPLVYAAAALSIGPLITVLSARGTLDLHAYPLPASSAIALLALGLVPTVIGHTLLQTGARTLSPSVVALVSPGETLGSIAIASVLFRKPPTLLEASGGAVILFGTLVAIRRST